MTKISLPLGLGRPPAGSGVTLKSRMERYFLRLAAAFGVVLTDSSLCKREVGRSATRLAPARRPARPRLLRGGDPPDVWRRFALVRLAEDFLNPPRSPF